MISGRGSNMKALVAAASQPDFPVALRMCSVIKQRRRAWIWAAAEGLETGIVDPKDADDIQGRLVGSGAELVCLAGYMRVLPSVVTDAWTGRMINIHPSLLPKHKGLNAQAKALAAGDKVAGATVHLVEADVDSGEILEQGRVDILPGDQEDTLSRRILSVEHQIYPRAVSRYAAAMLAQGKGYERDC